MATYQIETEDGSTYEIETDEEKQSKKLSVGQEALQLASQNPLVSLGTGIQQGADILGQATAEALASGVTPIPQAIPGLPIPGLAPTPGRGQVNPQIAAGIGTAIQMTPDILSSFIPVGEAANITQKGLGLARRGVSRLGKGIGAGERLAGLESRLLSQQEALGQVGIKAGEREAALLAEKQAVGKALGKAEELGGFAMKETPESFTQIIKDPKALNDFSSFMRKVSDKPINDLVKEADVNTLQTVRKFAQTFREIGPEVTNTVKANITAGGSKAREALSQIDETFGSVIKEWDKVSNKLDRLPLDIKKQKAGVQAAIRQTRTAIKETRQAIGRNKLLKTALLTATGGYWIGKFF